MPKNIRGGKGFKKQKKHADEPPPSSKHLITAEDDQIYCMVKKRLGGKRLEVLCSDGRTMKAVIPGKLKKKKIWLNPADVILCSIGPLGNPEECYIEHKYTAIDANKLKGMGIKFEEHAEDGECTFTLGEAKEVERNNINIYDEMDMMDSEYSYESYDDSNGG